MISGVSIYIFLQISLGALACNRFGLRSQAQPRLGVFSVLTELDVSSTGRPSFKSENSGLYLFHYAPDDDSSGRWIVGSTLHRDYAVAYVTSWAVHPMLLNATLDESEHRARDDRGWHVLSNDIDWMQDSTMELVCMDSAARERDSVVFLDVESGVTSLSGFYVQVKRSAENVSHGGAIYSKVGGEKEGSMLMYRFEPSPADAGTWIIGENKGTDIGLAYIGMDDDKVSDAFPPSQWMFNLNRQWVSGSAHVIQSKHPNALFKEIRAHRGLGGVRSKLPHGGIGTQSTVMLTMHNGVRVPAVGLGTGGLQNPEASITAALSRGYRMLDLAREYGNEHIVQRIFETHTVNATTATPGFPLRREVFLLTKVWPTELGFRPTLTAVRKSLLDLRTSYIDAYLLHWPSCNSNIKWMHCQDVVEEGATWHESWRALEKAYSEGAVMSIGVSNFNDHLLQEAIDYGIIRPHLVQNHADMENLDLHVRELSHRHGILFMPYAFQRNYRHLSAKTVRLLESVAAAHEKTPRDIILRFFVQTGAVIIPRSDDPDHLAHNLEVSSSPSWSLTDAEMASLGWPADLGAWLQSLMIEQQEL